MIPVTFWRRTPVNVINGAPTTLSTASVPEAFQTGANNAGVAQVRNTAELVIHYSRNSAAVATVPAGNVTALNSSAYGRTLVALRKTFRASAGDTDPGTISLAVGGHTGMVAHMALAGGDGDDPLGADGCVEVGGSGSSGVAAALPITENSRVIRAWFIRDTNEAPGNPSPIVTGREGAFNTSGNANLGFSYGYRVVDLGNYAAGETVPAQTSTFAGAGRLWTCVTVCIKLLTVPTPQIVAVGNIYGSFAGSVSINSNGNMSAGLLKEDDHMFVVGTEMNNPTGVWSGAGVTVINPGGIRNENTGMVYKKLGSTPDASVTLTANSINYGVGLSWVIVRGLDDNNPYTIAESYAATGTPTAPNVTANRATDISLGVAISTYVGSLTLTPAAGVNVSALTATSSSRAHRHAWNSGLVPLTPGSIAGPTWTHSPGSVNTLAMHLMLHAPPPVVAFAVSPIEIDTTVEAFAEASAGATFARAALAADLTMSARVRAFKSRRNPPRRELVWVYGLDGEQKGVIS